MFVETTFGMFARDISDWVLWVKLSSTGTVMVEVGGGSRLAGMTVRAVPSTRGVSTTVIGEVVQPVDW